MYSNQQMTPQQVSQFISTYGLPPPPNKYSPRRAKINTAIDGTAYGGVASIMSTPRGMRLSRGRQESSDLDIEGGDYDEGDERDLVRSKKLDTISETSTSSKRGKRSSRKRTLEIDAEDESDPDLQIVSPILD
jgi:hypothetical protein